MTGRAIVVFLAVLAVVSGVAMYWLQVYAFYDELSPDGMALTARDGTPRDIAAGAVTAIDANSSPIRFRACFTTDVPPGTLAADFTPAEDPTPLTGPAWFDCYDARAIGEALESGEAQAFLSVKNVHYGVDRIVAVYSDGRAYAWHQLNDCGELSYDGTPVGEACPPRDTPPESD